MKNLLNLTIVHAFCMRVFFFSYIDFKFCFSNHSYLRMTAVEIVRVSSVIVFLKSKFNNFFCKMESSDDSGSDYCIVMYKEGGETEPNKSSLNRTKR